MRQQDQDEVMASGGYTPLEALTVSIAVSDEAWCALEDGVPFVMWGVTDVDLGRGIVWLLGSEYILKIKKRFWIESFKYVRELHTRFSILANHVDARNSISRSWLERLGFVPVGAPVHFGDQNHPFIMYVSQRRHHASMSRVPPIEAS
jgi:hypothetical protein